MVPAVMFLFGMLASLRAVGDSEKFWPPDVVWASLSNPHRFQLCGGVATIVVAFALIIFMRRN